MRLTENQFLQFMKESGMRTRLVELNDLPWSKYQYHEFTKVIETGKVIASILYQPDNRHIFLSKREKSFSNLLGFLLFLIPLAFLIGAIWSSKYIFLLGIVAFFAAALMSNPWAESLRGWLIILCLVGVVLGFIYYWEIGVIFIGFLISIFLTVISRGYVNQIVRRQSLTSEILFCFAYQSRILLLKDTATSEVFGGK